MQSKLGFSSYEIFVNSSVFENCSTLSFFKCSFFFVIIHHFFFQLTQSFFKRHFKNDEKWSCIIGLNGNTFFHYFYIDKFDETSFQPWSPNMKTDLYSKWFWKTEMAKKLHNNNCKIDTWKHNKQMNHQANEFRQRVRCQSWRSTMSLFNHSK